MVKTRNISRQIIGIDPGIGGGLCCLGYWCGIVSLVKMPQTERDQWEWFESLPTCGDRLALIEWIHPAIQGIGKSPMSKLYGNYMAMRAFLIARHIPFQDIKPRKWQQALDISKRKPTENSTKWKNRLKGVAQQLYPKQKLTLATADALLIATVCHRLRQGGTVE